MLRRAENTTGGGKRKHMIDGIRVLSQEVLYSAGSEPVVAAIIAIVIAAGLTVVLAIKENEAIILPIGALVTIIVGLITGVMFEIAVAVPTDRYEYKVLIDDSVSMTEFHERYDLISVNGQIYTIRDKEVDK